MSRTKRHNNQLSDSIRMTRPYKRLKQNSFNVKNVADF